MSSGVTAEWLVCFLARGLCHGLQNAVLFTEAQKLLASPLFFLAVNQDFWSFKTAFTP